MKGETYLWRGLDNRIGGEEAVRGVHRSQSTQTRQNKMSPVVYECLILFSGLGILPPPGNLQGTSLYCFATVFKDSKGKRCEPEHLSKIRVSHDIEVEANVKVVANTQWWNSRKNQGVTARSSPMYTSPRSKERGRMLLSSVGILVISPLPESICALAIESITWPQAHVVYKHSRFRRTVA